jgi:hypothetical protein
MFLTDTTVKGIFEDIKGEIRIRKSEKDRIHNGQKEKDKRTNNDLQSFKNSRSSNTNPIKNLGELRCSGRVSSSCSISDTRRVTLITDPVISHE